MHRLLRLRAPRYGGQAADVYLIARFAVHFTGRNSTATTALLRALPAGGDVDLRAAFERAAAATAADPEELELEREMEYFVEPEETFTRDEIE